MQTTIDSGLARQIQRECGENVYLCYQCQKCSSGCPVAEHFDLAPNQLIRAIQLGQKAMVLQSRTLWLCAMCETCAVRCPHDINITKIMDALKIMAQKEGLASPLPSAVLFNQAALRGIRVFGKMYEAGLMGEITLRQMAAGRFGLSAIPEKGSAAGAPDGQKGKAQALPLLRKGERGEESGREKRSDRLLPRLQPARNLERVRPLRAGRAFNTGGRPGRAEELVLLREHARPFHGSLPFRLASPRKRAGDGKGGVRPHHHPLSLLFHPAEDGAAGEPGSRDRGAAPRRMGRNSPRRI